MWKILNKVTSRQNPKRWRNKDDFFFEFFQNPQHDWIVKDKYIKANFEEFFTYVPLKTLEKLYGNGDIWFITSSGRFSCAVEPIGCSVILVFPEFLQMLRSTHPGGAKAILGHELGHIYHNHSSKRIDVLQAQVEADGFVIELGFAKELEDFLNDQVEGTEKRVRLSYLTSKVFEEFYN